MHWSLFAFLGPSSFARWSKEEEADAHYEEKKISVRILSDASVEITEEAVVVIDKQPAIKEFSTLETTYVPQLNQVKFLSVSTTFGGQTIFTRPNQIEDKEIAVQAGYDSVRMIRTSLPQIAIGSKIHYKIWQKSYPHSVKQISEQLFLSEAYPVKSFQLQLDASIPFQYKLIDPQNQLKLIEIGSPNRKHIQITSASSLYRKIVDEPYSAISAPSHPTLFLSSETSWQSFSAPLSAQYEHNLTSSLPKEFEAIVEKAKIKIDRFDQVEFVMNELQTLIHYVGIWQTIRGRYFPRSLSEIATTRFGDCKDYSLATTAILRRLGLDVTPAWTSVQPQTTESETSHRPTLVQFHPPLPGLFFNHAIVKWSFEGKTYWLDPTNPISYSRGVPPQLAGTYALPLKRDGAALETIPFPGLNENAYDSKNFILLNTDRTADSITRIQFKGFLSSLIGYQSSTAKTNIDSVDKILEKSADKRNTLVISSAGQSIDRSQTGIDLSGSTSIGAGLTFSFNPILNSLVMDHSQTVGHLFLATPGTWHDVTLIQGGELIGDLPPLCSVDHSGFKAERNFKIEGDAIYVTEDIQIKTAMIQNSDLHAKAFKDVQETLRKCWGKTTLILKPKKFEITPQTGRFSQPWKLTDWDFRKEKAKKIGYDWIDTLHSFFRPASPSSTEGFSSLAPTWSAHKSTRQLKDKAKELLDNWRGDSTMALVAKFLLLESIAKEPKDSEAFAHLALSEMYLGYIKGDEHQPKSLDRAKVNVEHALELNPLDPIANRTLANYLIREKKYEDALAQVETTIKLDPTDEKTKSLKAKALLRLERPEQALTALGSIRDYVLLQSIHTALKKFDEVEKAYEGEIENKPSAWAYLNFSFFLSSQQKYDRAIETAKKSLELGETGMGHQALAKAYSGKGFELIKAQKQQEALAMFQKSLAETNDNVDAYNGLGWLFMTSGMQQNNDALLQQAFAQFSLALKISPDSKDAQDSLQRIVQFLNSRQPASLNKPPQR